MIYLAALKRRTKFCHWRRRKQLPTTKQAMRSLRGFLRYYRCFLLMVIFLHCYRITSCARPHKSDDLCIACILIEFFHIAHFALVESVDCTERQQSSWFCAVSPKRPVFANCGANRGHYLHGSGTLCCTILVMFFPLISFPLSLSLSKRPLSLSLSLSKRPLSLSLATTFLCVCAGRKSSREYHIRCMYYGCSGMLNKSWSCS